MEVLLAYQLSRTDNKEFPDYLLPSILIIHHFWQVL